MGRAWLGLALAGVVAAGLPGSALAARATVETQDTSDEHGTAVGRGSVVHYVADPGEANRLLITAETPTPGRRAYRLDDPGATISPGPGCSRIDADAVRCFDETTGACGPLEVDLGDRDDLLRTAAECAVAERLSVLGGAGADEIDGTSNDDVLDGGPGPDIMHAGAGSDLLRDGDTSLAPARDILDGGDNPVGPEFLQDVVDYSTHRNPVRVDLPSDVGGEPGENDVLEDIEGATGGGGGGDVLVGDAGPNRLSDGDLSQPGGTDRLYGRGGADELFSAAGRDLLSGGEGDDTLQSNLFNFRGVRALGGSGDDRIIGGRGHDLLRGGSGDDWLSGGRGDDVMSGNSGDDRLEGWRGDDRLYGRSGDDRLNGEDGDDLLVGGSGVDVFVGGRGRDRLRR
jgi:RTX calcium-binding nonapeptide repeat (4 copies)